MTRAEFLKNRFTDDPKPEVDALTLDTKLNLALTIINFIMLTWILW